LKIQKLGSQLNSIELNQESYILTLEEENEIYLNELKRIKLDAVRSMAAVYKTKSEIEYKMSQIDFDAKIDKLKLFSICNSNKHQALWHKNQELKRKEDERSRIENIKKTCDAKYFYKLIAYNSPLICPKQSQLIYNSQTEHLIKTICFFMSDDERFETELGYDFKKGLWIRGISGLGKTHIVKCVADNERKPIKIHSVLDINSKLKDDGKYHINISDYNYIDDVGTEELEVWFYKTKMGSWFKEFIENYVMKNMPYNKLIVSTNLSFDEVESRYSYRVRSRVRGMFNIVDVVGSDLR